LYTRKISISLVKNNGKQQRQKSAKEEEVKNLVFVVYLFLVNCLVLSVNAATAPPQRLPFMEGEVWHCSQGNNQGPTHTGSLRYAWDFNWGGTGYADLGKPVSAPANGTISFAGWKGGGWGNVVIIDYDEGEDAFGRLAHLDTILVTVGERVTASQTVGLCGGTGGWIPHLHYQTENSSGWSIPSSFLEAGVPVSDGYYLSQNSQLFCDAFNRHGGADNLGSPQNAIHWYFEYTPHMTSPSCYIQDYNGGDYGWCALVYDALGGAHRVHLIRTGFWGTWRTLGAGGPRSPLGQVLNSEYYYQGTARQDFTFGYMVWNNGHTDITYYSDIGSTSPGFGSLGGTQCFIDYYNDHGAGATFGNATRQVSGNPGVQTWGNFQIQYFNGGTFGLCAITYDPNTRNANKLAHVIKGNHFTEYMNRWCPGQAGSFIGPPSSDPFTALTNGDLRQNFQDGYYMLAQSNQVRVYAGNNKVLDSQNLSIPEAVATNDDGEQSCDPTFHVSWPVPPDTNDFYLQIATDKNFQQVAWEGWVGSTSGDKAYVGEYGNTYYARVRRQGTNGVLSAWGNRSDGIRVGCAVPCSDEGVLSNDPTVHFFYPVPDGIERAYMQISRNPDFTSIAWQGEMAPTGDKVFSGENDQTYYARVKLKEGGHWGGYGDPSNGITIGMVFPCLDDGDLSVDPCFHVSIEYVPGMVRGRFQIATDLSFTANAIVYEGEPSGLDVAFNGQYGQTYYGRGKVLDTGGHWNGWGAPSDGITVGRIPVCWDEGEISIDTNFHIFYETIAGIDQVEMQIATNPSFTNIFWQGIVPYTGSKACNGVYGQTYYGRVKVKERGHWSGWGTPSDGITIGLDWGDGGVWDDGDYSADTAVVFDLKVVSGIDLMNLQIATDTNFQNIVVNENGLWSRYEFDGEPETEYWARLRYRENNVWSDFSPISDGILVTLDSWVGDEGEVSPHRIVTFDFDSYEGVQNVYCQVARDPQFSDVVWEGWTNNVTGEFRYTGSPGDYLYARVKLLDNLGNVSAVGQASDGILIRSQAPPLMPWLSPWYPLNVNPNLLRNGGFEAGLEHWLLEDHLGGAQVFADDQEATVGRYCLKITQSEEAPEFYQTQLKQVGLEIEAGWDYTVTFWAKAEAPRPLWVLLMDDNEPWENFGLFEIADLTTEWQEFNFDFIATETTFTDNRFSFALGCFPETVWIDQVSLRQH
jgi:hypothetical protein